MKNLIRLFLTFSLAFIMIHNIYSQEYIVNKSFMGDTTINIFKNTEIIGSLKLNADIQLNSTVSLVRVILIDKGYSERVVYEGYYPLVNIGSFTINNVSDETEILNNIIPSYLKIQIIDARIKIKSLILGSPISSQKSASVESDQKMLVETKNKQKINQINRINAQNGQKWFAGETSISKLSYEMKKQLFGREKYNSNGLEYYVGGVFELNEATALQNVKSSSVAVSSTTSSLIDNFDWRERHGANNPNSPYYDDDPNGGGWLTSVKTQ